MVIFCSPGGIIKRFTVKVEYQCEDGATAFVDLGIVECGPCQSASDVGLTLADTKPILRRLQEVVVSEQLRKHCGAARQCRTCRRLRHVKDVRERRLHTTLGTVDVVSRCSRGCRKFGDPPTVSPLSALLPERISPEVLHLQAKLATQLPYRQAAAFLRAVLPETGVSTTLRHATGRPRLGSRL